MSYDVRPLFFFIEPQKTYYFHGLVKEEGLMDGKSFLLTIQARGYLLVDNISIHPVKVR